MPATADTSGQAPRAPLVDNERRRGRGARSNATGRFEREGREEVDDGWESLATLEAFKTQVRVEPARSIITTNDSPDISFDQSINPYRGCEHGCIYCYARPTHAFLGHSPGLDFETKLYAKTNAAELLERELAHPRYQPKTIALGTNTDPYQPIERSPGHHPQHPRGAGARPPPGRHRHQVRAGDARHRHPGPHGPRRPRQSRPLGHHARPYHRAAHGAARRDPAEAARGHPPACGRRRPRPGHGRPHHPGLNDSEIEAILEAAHAAGASEAGYVLLRLPLELKELFREWLATEFPDRAKRVIALLQSMHGGKDYVAEFGIRQRGTGPYADQIALRFRLALKRLGMNERRLPLRTDLFQRPALPGTQLSLL